MDILLLTAYYPPDVGSASHLFHDLGRALVKRRHRVSVVTGFPSYHAQGDLSRYRGRRWMVEEQDGLPVHRIAVPQVARNCRVGRALWQFSCAASFALAGLRVPRPDVVLVYSPPLCLGLTALAWRALRAVPFVLNVQDLFPQSVIDLGIVRHPILIRCFRVMERFIYQRVDALTVHSTGNLQSVIACGAPPERTQVIHNYVDIDHLRPGPHDNELRHELGLDGCFVVSFAGVIGFSQDLDTVLEAARLVQDDGIRFLLVGDGTEKDRLVKKTHDMALGNVIWMPMQPRERYPQVLHASDVSLATLHAKVKTPVVPSKILSIMAAGRPVVAAMELSGDAPRLIHEAKAGFCLAPEQPQALAECILRLRHQPDLCKRLGESGRQYAETHFSPRAAAERYEGLFSKLVSCRQGA